MCPGGSVIAAASECGGLVTNGMSQYARDGQNANSAIVVEVFPADFTDHPLGGVEFQRFWEKKAFQIGGEEYSAPVQLVGDFIRNEFSSSFGEVTPTYKPGTKFADLRMLCPDYVIKAILEALPVFDQKIAGFMKSDAVFTAVETRTSAPLRILRGKDYQSLSIEGLYPVGEGSGYAGGIMSSAVDGIKTAELIIEKMNEI
jgi:uncharacterized FAD-dependent dehydrogenase